MARKSLNIAMLGHKHVLSREGGVEIVVKELSTRLVARGHTVICYDRKSHHVSGVDIADLEIFPYRKYLLLFLLFSSYA